jgi:hypothetical protein
MNYLGFLASQLRHHGHAAASLGSRQNIKGGMLMVIARTVCAALLLVSALALAGCPEVAQNTGGSSQSGGSKSGSAGD